MVEENDDNFLYSPYIAAIADKDETAQLEFFKRFSQLDQPTKDFLTSPDVAEQIGKLIESGGVPGEYGLAVAKVVAFTVMGDVQLASVGQLLMKLGLPEEQSQKIAADIAHIVRPLTAEKGRVVVPQKMQEIPAMSRATETGPKPVPSSGTPARNIIDLRNRN